MEKTKKHARRDWSYLTPDLLVLIASKVVSFSDLLCFKEVCSSWRIAAHGINRKPFSMLVFFADRHRTTKDDVIHDDDVYDDVQFITINQKKPYKLFNITCSVKHNIRYHQMVGSNRQGWLIMLDRNNQPYFVQLFSWIRIPLPGLNTRFTTKRIQKARLSTHNSTHFVVLMMDHEGRRGNDIYIWRTGDTNWTGLEHGNNYIYIDIALCGRKVYTLHNNDGSVHVELWDFGYPEEGILSTSMDVPDLKYSVNLYVKLVCSSEGEILIVNCLRNKYIIWEVDFSEEQCEEVNSLSGNTLIIGDVTSAFVKANEVEYYAYKPNSYTWLESSIIIIHILLEEDSGVISY